MGELAESRSPAHREGLGQFQERVRKLPLRSQSGTRKQIEDEVNTYEGPKERKMKQTQRRKEMAQCAML